LRAARRDFFLSAAQVAFHYGGYTLETAIGLSHDERDLLLAVARDEGEQTWDRLGRTLGTKWEMRSLIGMLDDQKEDENAEPKPMPTTINIPLLMAAAPEFLKSIIDEYKKKHSAMLSTMREAGGVPVVEIGSLTSEQARALYKHIGAQVASARPPED